ncbi:MAG: hypothetical protein KUG65_12100 [Sphingomonadaceae bacterium]|nr:hypothetical protein [Sphingomonadaceae bacterium]
MADRDPQELLKEEARVTYGQVPHGLGGEILAEDSWQLAGDEFLLRDGANHYFHYRKGGGIVIERGEGVDPSVEALWVNGSVYSALACINGFMPIHASAICHDGAVYAFTGESGAGKSTLVTALVAGGFTMFCDDTLVLDLSDPDQIMCLPGHKRLKLTAEALALTGAAQEEKVGQGIEKFYARPAAVYSGDALPLGKLVFLEEGESLAIEDIKGAERLTRLNDDHYTAFHFAAARQFDPASRFAHMARLAGQIEMVRYVRPRDIARFDAGVAHMQGYITGPTQKDPNRR